MFAQIIMGAAVPSPHIGTGGIGGIGCEELISALQRERGFSGALTLIDRSSGKVMVIVLWDTEEQARLPPSLHGTEFRDVLSHITHVSADACSAISVWEVTLEL